MNCFLPQNILLNMLGRVSTGGPDLKWEISNPVGFSLYVSLYLPLFNIYIKGYLSHLPLTFAERYWQLWHWQTSPQWILYGLTNLLIFFFSCTTLRTIYPFMFDFLLLKDLSLFYVCIHRCLYDVLVGISIQLYMPWLCTPYVSICSHVRISIMYLWTVNVGLSICIYVQSCGYINIYVWAVHVGISRYIHVQWVWVYPYVSVSSAWGYRKARVLSDILEMSQMH